MIVLAIALLIGLFVLSNHFVVFFRSVYRDRARHSAVDWSIRSICWFTVSTQVRLHIVLFC